MKNLKSDSITLLTIVKMLVLPLVIFEVFGDQVDAFLYYIYEADSFLAKVIRWASVTGFIVSIIMQLEKAAKEELKD